MNKLAFCLILVGLTTLSSCNFGNEDESEKGVSSFSQLTPTFYNSVAQSIWISANGRYILLRGDNKTNVVTFLFSKDGGSNFEPVTTTESRFQYFQVQGIGNDGRILFRDNQNFYLYENGNLTKPTPPNGGYWDLGYLDQSGNYYVFLNCNCSTKGANGLTVMKSGSGTFTEIQIPEGMEFNYKGAAHTGIYFANSHNQTLYKHEPSTNTWVTSAYYGAELPNKVSLIGLDGNYYGANQYGVSRADAGGTVTEMPFPMELTNYQNPYKVLVTEDSRVFVILVEPNAMYEYVNGSWQLFIQFTRHHVFTEVAYSDGYLYYYGISSGKRPTAIIKHNFNTGAKTQMEISENGNEARVNDAIISASGTIFTSLDGRLYTYNADLEVLQEVEQLSDVTITTLQVNMDGRIFAMGEDLFVSEDDGATWTVSEVNFPMFQNHILQELSDGTFVAYTSSSYDYFLGGTGFSVIKFNNYYSTSQDGVNWTASAQFNGGYEITAVDRDGIIFAKRYDTNASYQVFTQGVRSDDNGATFTEFEGHVPDLYTLNGQLLALSPMLTPGVGEEREFFIWNGEAWAGKFVEIEATDHRFTKLHSLSDGRIVVLTASSAFVSNGSL